MGPVPIHYIIVIRYPQQMIQMAFCDLLHTFHKQVTTFSQHVLSSYGGDCDVSPYVLNYIFGIVLLMVSK